MALCATPPATKVSASRRLKKIPPPLVCAVSSTLLSESVRARQTCHACLPTIAAVLQGCCHRAVLDWLVQQGFIYQSNKDHYLPTLDLVAAP